MYQALRQLFQTLQFMFQAMQQYFSNAKIQKMCLMEEKFIENYER
jgi:hypothetical protein